MGHDKYKSAVLTSGLVTFVAAYRYMHWLLTVPLLLIEILLVMKLDDDTFSSKAKTLGVTSALMISRCTYPVVYLFPMLGISASAAVVGIQVGYCASDIISKCGVGLLIYQITYAKSKQEQLLR